MLAQTKLETDCNVQNTLNTLGWHLLFDTNLYILEYY